MVPRNRHRNRRGRSAPPPHPGGDRDLIYGVHAVAAALANPARRLVRLRATANAAARLADVIARSGVAVETVDPATLSRRLGAEAVHQGLLLEAEPLPPAGLDSLDGASPVVVLDQVTDPHNLGAVLRTAAAFGAAAVVTTERHSAHAGAVLAKAASGAVEHVALIRVANLARALADMKARGYFVIGFDGAAELSLDDAAPLHPAALVFGAEGKGLRRLTRESCDRLVRIPLAGPIDSLNVSAAVAVALYAWSRDGSPAGERAS